MKIALEGGYQLAIQTLAEPKERRVISTQNVIHQPEMRYRTKKCSAVYSLT